MGLLEFNIEGSGETRNVTIRGALKFGDHKIIDAITEVLDEETVEHLNMDLAELSKLDSYGIGVLLKCDQLSKDRNKSMTVCNVDGNIAELFGMFKLDETLTVIKSNG